MTETPESPDRPAWDVASAAYFDPTTMAMTPPAEHLRPAADPFTPVSPPADPFTPVASPVDPFASVASPADPDGTVVVGRFEPARQQQHYPAGPSDWPAADGFGTTEQLQPLPPLPPGRGYGKLPVIVAALAVLLVAGAAGGVVLMRASDRTDAAGTDPTPPVTPTDTVTTEVTPTETVTTDYTPTTESTPTGSTPTESTPTVDPQEAALTRLESLRAQDLGTVTFDSRFVAQIASKYPGVSDPYQTAADGTHTFQLSDILAEHERLRSEHGDTEHPVILLKSTDYGKQQLVGGEPLWVTFAVGEFPDKAAVLAWCSTHFGHLSPTELKNQCDSRNLRPVT
ncbi:hypothetical protein [Actinoplanes subglobosus]|uniref:Serine/threonine protein kinase n=1 Tax=Actinoplanes subglobosus TaxID=1547892 RepID=A0ABV8J2M2_9ACTN